jgi:hypothetical protein
MILPERITYQWIGSLDNEALLTVEHDLKLAFATEETAHRRMVGDRYDLMRGPTELLSAWDRWSRVNTETRSRKLHPRR